MTQFFPEYGQCVTYRNQACYISRKFSFADGSQKVTLYLLVAKGIRKWVDATEVGA